jgi:solute carrier family 25 2-oxodicarboxylate transporter 21
MYNGLESTLWRHVMWNAGYFGIIHQVKTMLPKQETKKGTMMNDLIAGSIGGAVGTILNTPHVSRVLRSGGIVLTIAYRFDVVKSRIQNTTRVPGVIPKYNWTLPSVALVAKEEGFSALYKGFIPKVLRLGPGGGILLVVFTIVVDYWKATQV